MVALVFRELCRSPTKAKSFWAGLMQHPKHPSHKTITIKAKTKKRYSLIDDASLLTLMVTVGRKTELTPQMREAADMSLEGIYLLPTNNILELFVDQSGKQRGYLFNNIDVWLSFNQSDALT